ncbi:MAG: 6-carboxytetrahydropterin synthase [Alloprevotella sp.]|nr:6-carboxytetrahydropterin synthase [Alloprevotella sp.]
MYYIEKQLEISFAHKLNLNYESKCTNLHGHNAIIRIYCKAEQLDANGMVTDFSVISQRIKDALDHKYMNELFPFNPTAENLARWICEQVPNCYKVSFQESEDNVAVYECDL